MWRRSGVTILATGIIAASALGALASSTSTKAATVPAYDHVFVIVEENHGFTDVIGNPAAPNLNALANTYGLSTDYYGVTHPSEPNYVALLGGDTFGVSSDNAYYTQTVTKPNLISQLDGAGVSWKAYLQGLPHPNFQGICYPANCNGVPDKDPLYVSKHDAIQNFTTSRTAADWQRQVPVEQLAQDLTSGSVPRFGYIVPDECHDQHGDPPYCLDGGNPFDPQDQHLVAQGDQYLGQLVSSLTSAAFWSHGNNAIDIVYDEGDDNAGCCNANPGGGRVANVVVTNNGPRGVQDNTPANHYSLLATIQQAFGLGCLANTCDATKIKPLSALFATGTSTPAATTPIVPPAFATPTPTPAEPQVTTTQTSTSGGWAVQPAAAWGSNDNSLGAVAVTSPTDAWAAGDFLPDTPESNQDATLSLAEHWNGTGWTATPTPNAGPNFDTFFGIAGSAAHAWAVGVALGSSYQDQALVETWDGSAWSLTNVPQPGAQRDILFAVSASSPSDVWAVGDQQAAGGAFETLVEHFDGSTWTTVPALDPGPGGNHFYGVTASGPDDVWAVGEALSSGGFDQALAEHFDGTAWHVVPTPATPNASSMLFSVTAAGGRVLAAGQTEGAAAGAHPLAEQLSTSGASLVALPGVPGNWGQLDGAAADPDHTWVTGWLTDPATGNFQVIVMRRDGDAAWHVVSAPNPGGSGGNNILGNVASGGGLSVASGVYDGSSSRLPLVESHLSGS